MRFWNNIFAGVALLIFLVGAPAASLCQAKSSKTAGNYDRGVFFRTDGSLPNGVCFRVSGSMNAPGFFGHLKRIDDARGTVFRRGTETVTDFPDELLLSFAIHDQPCAPGLREIETRAYLTQEMISALHLSFYWKRGMALRPVKNVTEIRSSVEPIVPYAAKLAAELPKRFVWSYQLAVPSKGVPLTDSFVLVFRTADGRINDGRTADGRTNDGRAAGWRIAARVAARL